MRRNILIDPRLQWKFILSFTCLASAAVVFEAIVVNRMLANLSGTMPEGGDVLRSEMTGILFQGIGYTLVLLVPISVTMGMLATFRVAGPLFAIRRYLRRLAAGEEVGDCRIRERDELHDLCDAVNGAVGALRARLESSDADSSEAPEASERSDAATDGEAGDGADLRLAS